MSGPSKKVAAATMTALADVVGDVPLPASRARSFSFASMLADMAVGDAPVSKTIKIDPEALSQMDFKEAVSVYKERLRNSIASSVSAARRRVESQYSIECSTMTADTGLYVVALIHRIQ